MFPCEFCTKSYQEKKNLQRHLRQSHPSEAVVKTYKFKCEECPRKYTSREDFRWHIRRFHGSGVPDGRDRKVKLRKCPLCASSMEKNALITHFEDDHYIKVCKSELSFGTLEEFNEWKEKMETDTKSQFVRETGVKATKQKTKTTSWYFCHRSGHFVSRSKGGRRQKWQGSNKINGFCPAGLKVVVDKKSEQCFVTFVKTHVGHPDETLSLFVKQIENVQTEVEKILDANLAVERCDDVRVQAWVDEIDCDDESCILFYKPKGSVNEQCTQFEIDDFALVIMNETQCELLKKYGNECVCLDCIHDTSNNLKLVILLAIDEKQEGFPCALFVTSRIDTTAVTYFLSKIKEKSGDVAPVVLMSDVEKCFINSWNNVMAPPKEVLYCSWHVNRDWRENIEKIESKVQQAKVSRKLRNLMKVKDTSTFKKMAETFANMLLEDEKTSDFEKYFTQHYTKSSSSWAYSFRTNSGLNADINVGKIHSELKFHFLQEPVKALDKTICILMKFIRDRFFQRLVVFQKHEVLSKMGFLQQRHKASLALSTDAVQTKEGYWLVCMSLEEVLKTNLVQRIREKCSCRLVCSKCSACIHQYSCTCTDSSIRWNMCEHIHLVCRFQNPTFVAEASSTDEDGNEYMEIESNSSEQEELEQPSIEINLHTYAISYESASLTKRKKAAIRKLNEIVNIVSTDEQMNAVDKSLALLYSVIAPLKPPENNEIANYIIVPYETVTPKSLMPQTSVKRIAQQSSVSAKKQKLIKLPEILPKPKVEEQQGAVQLVVMYNENQIAAEQEQKA